VKRIMLCLLCFVLLFSLPACGKKKKQEQGNTNVVVSAAPTVYEVEITPQNIFDYFDFKQYPTHLKDEDGNVTSVQIAYGLELKEGYYAANSDEYEDTMELSFTAEGVVNEGTFTIDFDTLQYGGTITETSYVTVSETLKFWPKGNRTTVWSFGLFSRGYVNYFQNFVITDAKGSIFIKTTP